MDSKIILTVIIIAVVIALVGLYSCTKYWTIDKGKSDNYYYNFYKTKVHYIPMGNSFELGNDKMDSVDISTAEVISDYFLKDKEHVYFQATLIKNADVNSFQLLDSANRFYAKDKNTVYYGSNSFKDIDVNSYQFPNEKIGSIIKDKEHVYSVFSVDQYTSKNGVILPVKGLHANSYQSLNDSYGKDEMIACFEGSPILNSDSKTFMLTGEYAKDAIHVYYRGIIISGMDANTLVAIEGGGYYKDKDYVYYGLNTESNDKGETLSYSSKIVPGADPETFEMVEGEKIDYAKDKKSYYWGGKPQCFDPLCSRFR